VNAIHEPSVSLGEPAAAMTASITVDGPAPGRDYALLRYDDYTAVPTGATAAELLASSYRHRIDFTASGTQWTRVDQTSVPSSAATYDRCIAR
jgi:hypothetical protein